MSINAFKYRTATSALMQFINSNVLDSLEVLDKKFATPDALRDCEFAKLVCFPSQLSPLDTTYEFIWKGKIAVTFKFSTGDLGGIICHAIHHYDADSEVTRAVS